MAVFKNLFSLSPRIILFIGNDGILTESEPNFLNIPKIEEIVN